MLSDTLQWFLHMIMQNAVFHLEYEAYMRPRVHDNVTMI